MFCPNCSNQNLDNAKFCRACGIDLEIVALAMSNKLAPPSNWLEKYGESKSKVVAGAIITGSALLILIIPLILLRDPRIWAIAWAFLFGWLAALGIIKFAGSVGALVKAKTMLKAQNPSGAELPGGEQSGLPQTPANYQLPDSRYATDQLQTPHSVTEHTTKFLNKQ